MQAEFYANVVGWLKACFVHGVLEKMFLLRISIGGGRNAGSESGGGVIIKTYLQQNSYTRAYTNIHSKPVLSLYTNASYIFEVYNINLNLNVS